MNILLVEDEPRLATLVCDAFKQEGANVVHVDSAEKALDLVKHESIDMYILDITLPNMSGIELCKVLRSKNIKSPIVLLTAKDSLSDRIDGLDSGADDYLTKPFEFGELFARVRALTRKNQGYLQPNLAIADLTIDPNKKIAIRNNNHIDLSKKEYLLLELLVSNRGQVLSRPEILSQVWNENGNTYTNVLDVFINSLRKKVDGDNDIKLIKTIRGKGFMISD